MSRLTTFASALMLAPVFATGQTCGLGSELLPFVPAAGWRDGLQGFVRLVNPRPDAAMVAFTAHDDAGNAHDLSVQLQPYETLHFNSADLEDGNVDKGGLAGMIVNLMASPTGHVTNLSADHTDAWIRR